MFLLFFVIVLRRAVVDEFGRLFPSFIAQHDRQLYLWTCDANVREGRFFFSLNKTRYGKRKLVVRTAPETHSIFFESQFSNPENRIPSI